MVDIGKGVTSVKKGDHVIPLYTPECRQCLVLPVAQDQSLHRDPRDARPGSRLPDGNLTVLRQALEACHRGWGQST